MSQLPPSDTPLNQHSLMAIEFWLDQLGAKKSNSDPCRWEWVLPDWSACIDVEQDELRITWDKGGEQSQCSFPYGLSRKDVEVTMTEGP